MRTIDSMLPFNRLCVAKLNTKIDSVRRLREPATSVRTCAPINAFLSEKLLLKTIAFPF